MPVIEALCCSCRYIKITLITLGLLINFKIIYSTIINFNFIFTEEECYHCMTNLVAAKEKMFITQTKLLYEVTWKTVMQIAKKHVVSLVTNIFI